MSESLPDAWAARLSAHLDGRTELSTTSVPVCGETYHLTHPASADALFDEQEFARDERIPYWADLWPSAISLSRCLCGLDLSGKRVIELGCGIGLPGIVASSRGARVTATDHYPEALDFAAYNAWRNGGSLKTSHLDWNAPELDGFGVFDFVLGADVLYEKRNVKPMAELVERLLASEGQMLLADPARLGGSLFLEEMDERGFEVPAEETKVEQDGREVTVMIYRIRR